MGLVAGRFLQLPGNKKPTPALGLAGVGFCSFMELAAGARDQVTWPKTPARQPCCETRLRNSTAKPDRETRLGRFLRGNTRDRLPLGASRMRRAPSGGYFRTLLPEEVVPSRVAVRETPLPDAFTASSASASFAADAVSVGAANCFHPRTDQCA